MMMMKKKKGQRNSGMGGLEWEMRPGGMLVQKRNSDSSNHSNSNPYNNIKIRVTYNSSLHQIQINPHSTFGELKKILQGPTGVDPQDQKLMFNQRERDSNQFLHIVGVKDGSTLDLLSQDTGFLLHLTSNPAMKSVAEVTIEIDKLAGQVTRLESVIAKGGIVGEKQVLNLTEMLMSLLIRLDAIVADGDIKLQRKSQVIRVQRYIETLDMLKAQNKQIQQGKQILKLQRYQPQEQMIVGGQVPRFTNFATQQRAIVTTKWANF